MTNDLTSGSTTQDFISGPTTHDFTFGPFGNSLGLGPIVFAASPGSEYVTSIQESAIYWGRDGSDTFLLATDPDNPLQIDLVIGDLAESELFPEVGASSRDWQNRFILGDWNRPYYVNDSPFPLGLNQFAVIADFNPELDQIQLHGNLEDYQLVTTPLGTAMFWQQSPTPDLVAFVYSASDLSLESNYFQFEGDTPPEGPVEKTIEQLGTDGIDSIISSTTDPCGNVYVAGGTKDNIWVAKYDNHGNQLWIQDFGTADFETATDIVSDQEGNFYLVGVTNGDLAAANAGSFDVWLAKYDSHGNQLWIEQFGNELVDLSYSINIDSNNNIYLSGHSGRVASEDDEESLLGQTLNPWITKYDNDGNRLWFQEFEDTGLSEAYDVVVDSNDNVYATGWTLGDLGGENEGLYDIWLAQLDSDGNPVWKEQFGSEDYEFPWGIDIDSQGNTYTTGWTLGDLGGDNAGFYDAWVAKYDSHGNQLWLKQFGTSGIEGPGTFFGDIKVDSNDDIYITGYTDNNLGGDNVGFYDAWVAKYDSHGNQLWTQQFGTPEYDYAGGISTDNSGNLFVTGITEGSLGDINVGAVDGWIAKLDAASGMLKDFNDHFV
ncbi:MAG: SBBP repeat-containing protein [Xenococcus sp. MO_188.B8]|nr:SBBP repeat-containing protein [Xenococcus sp. MO_188.B8]